MVQIRLIVSTHYILYHSKWVLVHVWYSQKYPKFSSPFSLDNNDSVIFSIVFSQSDSYEDIFFPYFIKVVKSSFNFLIN